MATHCKMVLLLIVSFKNPFLFINYSVQLEHATAHNIFHYYLLVSSHECQLERFALYQKQ